MSRSYPELIVHIGAGKTGSTAIQFSLRDAGPGVLADQGLAYFGLMLERVLAARSHDWCVQGQPQLYFQARDTERTDAEVEAAALAALAEAGDKGLTRAVWSNEAFLVQNHRILPLLKRLEGQGVPVRVVAYLRRHDARARSAYVEFALKSKRYKGPLKSFRDWLGFHPLTYAEPLAHWLDAFPGKVALFNFDAAGDVAQHFCDQVGLEGIAPSRANETPSDAVLTAWTVYNGSKEKATWANDFRRVAAPLKLHAQQPVPPLSELLPSEADLEAAQTLFHDDLSAVNKLLDSQGQPPLTFGPASAKMPEVSDWEMNRMLLQMVFTLQEQMLRLQRRLDRISPDTEPE